MKKQNIAIIAVIALVLAVSVGYALFSQTLTITGTATASGDFDVQFVPVDEVNDIRKDGYVATTEGTPITSLSNGNHTLNVAVDKLSYPGAYVEFDAYVVNNSSFPVVLKHIEQKYVDAAGNPTTDPEHIRVTYTSEASTNAVLDADPSKKHKFTVRVEWVSKGDDVAEDSNDITETANFQINLTYDQITVSTTSSSSASE